MPDNLVVLAFEGSDTAAQALQSLEAMHEEDKLVLKDAVVASMSENTVAQLTQWRSKTGKYVKGVAGVGLIAGLLLGGPIIGLVGGAAIGAMVRHLKDFGLDDDMVKEISEGLKPGSSALFLLVEAGSADVDQAVHSVRDLHGRVVKTSLSEEQDKALRTALEQ